MKLSLITPKSALNKSFLKVKPNRSEIEDFKTHLITLLGYVDDLEKEENQKNFLRDFLREIYYKNTNLINTKDNKDLVVHLGLTPTSKVGVIIEAKRPSSKIEMISESKPNCKALHEIILYYFDERDKYQNNELKHLIISNVYEWFIFDANLFDKIIYRNTRIKRLYETYVKDKKDTTFFYEEVSKIIPLIENEIQCAYFDIRKFESIVKNDNKEDDKALIALYKLLSPVFLLKAPYVNDSNSLNQNFYKELLHIIGLEEVKSGSKNIIRRKEKDRQPGSLIENTINILETENSLYNVKDRSAYGNDKNEQLYNIALELSLTWINRILFLKLLEGLLITYHKGNKDYCFLNHETIPGFDELFKLFHSVLALNIGDRKANIQQKYSKVPYLNSSLFEISELENSTIKINSLDDSETIDLISTTVLREEKSRKITKLAPTEYLFKFLDAYDFASEGGEDIAEDNKTIINASVLGKVFEKINGYKDGSIFTPGFITMYMSRQALRLAVLQKFNDYFKSNQIAEVSTFDELYNPIARIEIKKANEIINSLRICDPAVGSGHFLVSSLNELIVIKSELGILIDKNGKLLKDYEIVVENDELIISDENGIFEYRYNNKESQRVQETIFNEKQTIIENCLFGVDINPNSVQICRLRLWIELLKSSYYRAETLNLQTEPELETLPNIDINIKCGNSLLSRFDLDSDLVKALQKSKWDITSYRNAVATYRNTKSREVKWEMEKLISEIKNSFETEIWLNDKRNIKLSELKGELFTLTNQEALFEMSQKEKDEWNKKINKLTADIQKQEQMIEEIRNNAIYKNAFEWRFEFPEVLNDNGDFVGFDVVIGNPPYISHDKIPDKEIIKSIYSVYEPFADLYCYFYEKAVILLNNSGNLYFITSNSFLKSDYGKILRTYFTENGDIISLINLEEAQIFQEAIVNVCLLAFSKNKFFQKAKIVNSIYHPSEDFNNHIKIKEFYYNQEDFQIHPWNLLQPKVLKLGQKIKGQNLTLQENNTFIRLGIATGLNNVFVINEQKRLELINEDIRNQEIIKPILRGREIKRYSYDKPDSYIILSKNGINIKEQYPKIYNYFDSFGDEFKNRGAKGQHWSNLRACSFFEDFKKDKIIWIELSDENRFAICNEEMYLLNSAYFLIPPDNYNSKYMLSILNSKIIKFYMTLIANTSGMGTTRWINNYIKEFPIPQISIEVQQPFIDLVDIILAKKANNEDTSQEEREIDRLVYQLYDLTEDEINIVEGE